MYDSEMRKDCPMRGNLGNCSPVGGFCNAVSDEICKAVHNAYDHGFHNATRMLKEQKEIKEQFIEAFNTIRDAYNAPAEKDGGQMKRPKETFWDSLSEADLMEPMRHFKD